MKISYQVQKKSGTTSSIFLREGFNLMLYFVRYICFDMIAQKKSDFEIFEKLRHEDDDYEDGCRYHSDFDKEIVLTTYLIPDADLDPNFTFPRVSASWLSGDNHGKCNSYHLQDLSLNPCPPRGDYHSAVVSHIYEPWHIICLQEDVGFANHTTLHYRFHVVYAHHCAFLLNKDTFERDVTTNSIMISAKKCIWEALEDIVVNGRFSTAVDGDCRHVWILNVHVSNMSAVRRSICVNLLLLIRSWRVQEEVTLLAGMSLRAQKSSFCSCRSTRTISKMIREKQNIKIMQKPLQKRKDHEVCLGRYMSGMHAKRSKGEWTDTPIQSRADQKIHVNRRKSRKRSGKRMQSVKKDRCLESRYDRSCSKKCCERLWFCKKRCSCSPVDGNPVGGNSACGRPSDSSMRFWSTRTTLWRSAQIVLKCLYLAGIGGQMCFGQ